MPVIIAYHGCSREVAESLVAGQDFIQSSRSYDWLGGGVYFWEDDPLRAYDWALNRRPASPSVVGVAVELGECLDLTKQSGARAVQRIYNVYRNEQQLLGIALPVNRDAPSGVRGDLALRHLDRAVIDYVNLVREQLGASPYQTIRALFPEGQPLYPNSGFRELTHVQICVRDPRVILGVFRIPEHQRLALNLPDLY